MHCRWCPANSHTMTTSQISPPHGLPPEKGMAFGISRRHSAQSIATYHTPVDSASRMRPSVDLCPVSRASCPSVESRMFAQITSRTPMRFSLKFSG